MSIFNFLRNKLFQKQDEVPQEKAYEYPYASPSQSSENSTSYTVNFDNADLLTASKEEPKEIFQEKIKYVQLSTAGDENVCPMCSQFEGKIFLSTDAPKLPLCPSCSCAYLHYFENDLPANAKISHKENFILPAECVFQFYKHQKIIFEESNINRQIRLLERDLKKLSEFMKPYLSAGFESPVELACRDLLPELYMKIGKWDKAEKTINICIDEKAYYPKNGLKQLSDFKSYRDVALETLSYISENPGCLQRNIYQKMAYEDEKKEYLKHFLRNSQQISKEKFGSTNKLYINTGENVS